MDRKVKQNGTLGLEPVDASELTQISGGIWRYTSRLGAAGAQMEQRQQDRYGVSFDATNLDDAAHKALENWVSIP